ncbi:MAG: AraC family transcriptional regulator [Verrucomicrobiota bacterium]
MDERRNFGFIIHKIICEWYKELVIRYLAYGVRRFGKQPMPIHPRTNWEFFVVLKGACGSTSETSLKPEFKSKNFWIFPPSYPHGWSGDRHSCEVAVFHFPSVPLPLEKAIPSKGYLERSLSSGEIRQIVQIVHQLMPHYESPHSHSPIHFEKALMELSLLALQNIVPQSIPKLQGNSELKSYKAMVWYLDHLKENPSIRDVAAAVHVSFSHLRRIFWQTQRASPQQVLHRLRIQRATELMAGSYIKLEAVAEACGFSSASNFCRTFREEKGVTPAKWREKIGIMPSRNGK